MTTPNPWERLREAALLVLEARSALTKQRGGVIADEHESLEVKGLALIVFEQEQELRAALAACPAAPPQTDFAWQPIETTPTEAPFLALLDNGSVCLMRRFVGWLDDERGPVPTRWMPLPYECPSNGESWFKRARATSHAISLLVRYDGKTHMFDADWLKAWQPPQPDAERERAIEEAITDFANAVEFDCTELECSEQSDETSECREKLRGMMHSAPSGDAKLRELRAFVAMRASSELFSKEDVRPRAWVMSPNEVLAEFDRMLRGGA